jgi:hypothetical protein
MDAVGVAEGVADGVVGLLGTAGAERKESTWEIPRVPATVKGFRFRSSADSTPGAADMDMPMAGPSMETPPGAPMIRASREFIRGSRAVSRVIPAEPFSLRVTSTLPEQEHRAQRKTRARTLIWKVLRIGIG